MFGKLDSWSVCAAVLLVLSTVGFAATASYGAGEASAASCGAGGPSTFFTLSGQVQNPKVYDLAALEKFHPKTAVQEVCTSGKGMQGPAEYEGVLLWDLLTEAVLIKDPNVKNDSGEMFVLVTGTDC